MYNVLMDNKDNMLMQYILHTNVMKAFDHLENTRKHLPLRTVHVVSMSSISRILPSANTYLLS